MLAAQLPERSLPTPQVRGSNPTNREECQFNKLMLHTKKDIRGDGIGPLKNIFTALTKRSVHALNSGHFIEILFYFSAVFGGANYHRRLFFRTYFII